MKVFCLRMVLVLSLIFVSAAGAAGPVWAEIPREIPPGDLKIEQWAGQAFTFLALTADKQAGGYEIFTADRAAQGFQGDRSARIPYSEYVGKQVTVTETVPFAVGYNQQEYMVNMTVNDTGEKLTGRTMRGQLEGLVLTADLNSARQQFLGKTVYSKSRELSGLQDTGGDSMRMPVAVTIGSPMSVVDVYAGNQSQEPILLVVLVNGRKAVLPIAYSWTNRPVESWTQTPPWQEALFMEDPRISLGGSADLWNEIQAGNIKEGMTKEQVRLSWGKPFQTEANDSTWYYGSKKLNFRGNLLDSIETFANDSAALTVH